VKPMDEKAWYRVKLTGAEWDSLVGPEDRSGDLESVELGLCCARISCIRDYLFECKRDGGVSCRRRTLLKNMMDGHDPVVGHRDCLNKLLDQLELEWGKR
jgi:hypothetical protein